MPDRYAVIGHPIAHSKSPLIHGLFAQATQQDMTYEAIDGGADDGGFMRALAAFRAAGGLGLNVTLPFKLQALAAADQASDDARLAGAANALRFEGERIEARNFDGIGLVRDIEVNLGLPLKGQRVLLLDNDDTVSFGSRAVCYAKRALEILATVKPFSGKQFIFITGKKDVAMSTMAMSMLLRRMDHGDVTVHGMRSTFRTWAGERSGYPFEVCEHALAHRLSDAVAAAYLRSDFFAKRTLLMADWEKYCESGLHA